MKLNILVTLLCLIIIFGTIITGFVQQEKTIQKQSIIIDSLSRDTTLIHYYRGPWQYEHRIEELGLVEVNGRPLMLIRHTTIDYSFREISKNVHKPRYER